MKSLRHVLVDMAVTFGVLAAELVHTIRTRRKAR